MSIVVVALKKLKIEKPKPKNKKLQKAMTKLEKKREKEKEKEKLKEKKKEESTSTSFLLGLLNGLNQKWKCYSVFYFFHFFLIRVGVTFLIFLSPFISSVYAWGALVLIQGYCTLQHLFVWMYEEFFDYFIAIFWELQIFFVVVYIFMIHFIPQNTET